MSALALDVSRDVASFGEAQRARLLIPFDFVQAMEGGGEDGPEAAELGARHKDGQEEVAPERRSAMEHSTAPKLEPGQPAPLGQHCGSGGEVRLDRPDSGDSHCSVVYSPS